MKQILNDERYPLSPWISKSLRKRHIRLGNTRPNKCNDSHKPSKYLPMDCFKLCSLSIFTSLSRDFCCCWNNFLRISFEKITSRMFPKGFGVDLVYLFNGYWVNLKQSLKRPQGNFNKGSWKHLLKREIYLAIRHTSNMNVMLFLTLLFFRMFTWYFISFWHLLRKNVFFYFDRRLHCE